MPLAEGIRIVINKFILIIMVDVLIRNMDERLYAQFKSDAAQRRLTLAEEFRLAFMHLKAKGLASDLAIMPTIRIGSKKAISASRNVDKIIGEADANDYLRLKRSRGLANRR